MIVNKKQKEKVLTILAVATLITAFIASLDVFAANVFWKSMGSLADKAYILSEPSYMVFFWGFSFAIIFIAAAVWYLSTKDKTEAFALGIISFLFVSSGLTDILYFLFQGQTIPASLPHLNSSIPGITAMIVGSAVTPFLLIENVIMFIMIAIIIAIYLVRMRG